MTQLVVFIIHLALSKVTHTLILPRDVSVISNKFKQDLMKMPSTKIEIVNALSGDLTPLWEEPWFSTRERMIMTSLSIPST